ncbi:MAG: hypothetical protein U0744_20180 [Gemmataceae bacterium]
MLGTRAAQTRRTIRRLTESSDTQLISELKVLLASYQTPAVLRLEIPANFSSNSEELRGSPRPRASARFFESSPLRSSHANRS